MPFSRYNRQIVLASLLFFYFKLKAYWTPQTIRELKALFPEEDKGEIGFLVEETLGLSSSELLFKEFPLTFRLRLKVAYRLAKYQVGMPLAYVLGTMPFAGMNFSVDRNVLIPRPETEDLALYIEGELSKVSKPLRLLDVGTGSGILAIYLKKKFPQAEVWAIDTSRGALKVAQKNAKTLLAKGDTINFQQHHFTSWTAFTREFGSKPWDLIVSNPPYISQKDYLSLSPSVRDYEPKKALISGEEGLDFYQALAVNIEAMMTKNGLIYLEFGLGQGKSLLNLFKKAQALSLLKDFTGRDRFLMGRF